MNSYLRPRVKISSAMATPLLKVTSPPSRATTVGNSGPPVATDHAFDSPFRSFAGQLAGTDLPVGVGRDGGLNFLQFEAITRQGKDQLRLVEATIRQEPSTPVHIAVAPSERVIGLSGAGCHRPRHGAEQCPENGHLHAAAHSVGGSGSNRIPWLPRLAGDFELGRGLDQVRSRRREAGVDMG